MCGYIWKQDGELRSIGVIDFAKELVIGYVPCRSYIRYKPGIGCTREDADVQTQKKMLDCQWISVVRT